MKMKLKIIVVALGLTMVSEALSGEVVTSPPTDPYAGAKKPAPEKTVTEKPPAEKPTEKPAPDKTAEKTTGILGGRRCDLQLFPNPDERASTGASSLPTMTRLKTVE